MRKKFDDTAKVTSTIGFQRKSMIFSERYRLKAEQMPS
jgi:hypothetical protein